MTEVPSTVEFPEPLPAERRSRTEWVVESDGVEVKLTNLDKPYWVSEGLTKADLVAYYWNAAGAVLPYLAGRPLTMKRMPDGADGEFFYAKNRPRGTPAWLRSVCVLSEADGKQVDYLVARTRADLLWLANAGCIELHPWHARIDDLGHPDYAFFDLDPMGAATFADVREAALLVRTVLDRLGLRGYPRTSGATGMQVFVPIDRVHTAAGVRTWVGEVCRLIARADPVRTTMEFTIAQRGDTVFLDHGMNTEGRNIAGTWSLRPERHAPVATPVSWEEVEAGLVPQDSTMATVWPRLEIGAAFQAVLKGGQDLRAAMRAVGLDPAKVEGAPRHRILDDPDDRTDVGAAGRGDRDGLQRYRAKRDFAVTPEPPPDPEPYRGPAAGAAGPGHDAVDATGPEGAPRFVVQHHLATRLHHDLRIEVDGVARSWALPRGLPEVEGLRHRAVPTEDHPPRYLDFSGDIPKGEYGGGPMRIWDRGTYEPVEVTSGKATIRLHGTRHTGEYHLFRTGGESEWLVTRARPSAPAPAPPPGFAPMLASSVDAPFDDDRWGFEVKWDGVRAVAQLRRPGFGDEPSTRLVSRAGNDVTDGYPELAGLWERILAFNATLDGEVVVLGPDGRPSFQLLQHRMHVRGDQARRAAGRTPATYVVFDVLAVDGEPLVDLPLAARLERLDALVVPGERLVRSAPVVGAGTSLYEAVRGRGLEGVVAKRLTSRYAPGRRSPEWRKIKVRKQALAVVGGWLGGEGSRASTLGALLVGVHDGEGRLQYAGRVGTGFDEAELLRLTGILAERAADTPPFADRRRLPPEARPRTGRARWCTPDLVCAVEYAEVTDSGRFRAPAYKGLRDDVEPSSVGAPA